MTPTLAGRLQTRLVLAATVGVVWTVILTPFLPHPLASDMAMNGSFGMIMLRNMQTVSTGQLSTTAMDYQMAFASLGLMTGFGLLWEVVYHGLQQLRRDRDWPPLFSLLVGVPEGLVVWFALHAVGITQNSLFPSNSNSPMFVIQFGSTWILLWLALLGPLRVVSARWHLDGMIFLRSWTGRRRAAGSVLPVGAGVRGRSPVGQPASVASTSSAT